MLLVFALGSAVTQTPINLPYQSSQVQFSFSELAKLRSPVTLCGRSQWLLIYGRTPTARLRTTRPSPARAQIEKR